MDRSLTDNADTTRRLRGADGKFIAASERVIMSNHNAGDLLVDPSRSPSVGPSEGDDSTLQTGYRQKPMLAPNTKAAATKTTSRSRWRAPLTDEEMWSESICDGGKAALAVTRGLSSPEENHRPAGKVPASEVGCSLQISVVGTPCLLPPGQERG